VYGRSAAAWALAPIATAAHGAIAAASVDLVPNPAISGGPAGKAYPSLIAAEFLAAGGGGGASAVVLNLAGSAYMLNASFLAAFRAYEHTSADPQAPISEVDAAHNVSVTAGALSAGQRLALPPYSITLLT
jgi:hypothetical protein